MLSINNIEDATLVRQVTEEEGNGKDDGLVEIRHPDRVPHPRNPELPGGEVRENNNVSYWSEQYPSQPYQPQPPCASNYGCSSDKQCVFVETFCTMPNICPELVNGLHKLKSGFVRYILAYHLNLQQLVKSMPAATLEYAIERTPAVGEILSQFNEEDLHLH
ncbi:hypothetical protein ACTXT7_016334 [Hymenolepis weldensis]